MYCFSAVHLLLYNKLKLERQVLVLELLLSKGQEEALNNIIDACKRKNISCYVVGGAVRDWLLQIPPRDIDICIDAEPLEIKNYVEYEDFIYYPEFHTSTVRFKNGVEFDIIRCRGEWYSFPGALPEVYPSNLENDLFRRDFTINAIAYDLFNREIIDPCNGIKDIKNKIVRSVHKESYKEDATRIFRAVKYGCRYNFTLFDMEEIKYCILNNSMDSISSDRYIKEVYSICGEEKWEEMLDFCSYLGIFQLEEYDKVNVLADLKDPDVRFLKFAYRVRDEKVLRSIINNSIINRKLKKAVLFLRTGDVRRQLYECSDNYEIHEILKSCSYLDLVMLCFDYKLTYKVLCYLMLQEKKLELDGNYVKNTAGIQGNKVGRVLDYIMKIKLNTGLVDDVKYFNKNLGEIIDAIEY